ncbi:hypothetical protein [Tritonibacter horizontis]|uniref:hypothetical protein n=1 Tax=Tritonibacter horizontis TaxID=1768241 RepID=UPI001041EE57|nr:hypothetical protein [Tritonibacter horizontis]
MQGFYHIQPFHRSCVRQAVVIVCALSPPGFGCAKSAQNCARLADPLSKAHRSGRTRNYTTGAKNAEKTTASLFMASNETKQKAGKPWPDAASGSKNGGACLSPNKK